MSIFSWNRLQNLAQSANNYYGGPGSDANTEDQGVVSQPQAPLPQTRAPLPSRNINAISDISRGDNQSPYQASPGLYGLGPDLNEPRPELDKYSGMLDQYPDRPSPSWMRTIATGALSFANAQQPDQITDQIGPNGKITRTVHHGVWKPMDIEESNKILQQPYEQDLADYRNKLAARREGANLERQTLTDKSLAAQRQSSAAKNIASIPQAWAKIDIQEARIRVAAFSAETRARAEQLAEALKDVPESERLKYVQQGRISVEDMHNVAALERVKLQQGGATERTRIQQGGALQREREQQTGALEREREQQSGATERTRMQQEGADTRQTEKQDTGSIPTQQISGQKLDFNKMVRDHPEWSNYVTQDSNGIPQLKTPSWQYGHPSQDVYNQMKSYLEGKKPTAKPAKPQAAGPANTAPGAARPANVPKDSIEMWAPDGKSTRWVPPAQADLAVSQGYSYKR